MAVQILKILLLGYFLQYASILAAQKQNYMNISLIGWYHQGSLIVKNLRQPWLMSLGIFDLVFTDLRLREGSRKQTATFKLLRAALKKKGTKVNLHFSYKKSPIHICFSFWVPYVPYFPQNWMTSVGFGIWLSNTTEKIPVPPPQRDVYFSICVSIWFLNSFHYKLSCIWLWGSLKPTSSYIVHLRIDDGQTDRHCPNPLIDSAHLVGWAGWKTSHLVSWASHYWVL